MPIKENVFSGFQWLIIPILLSVIILSGIHYYRITLDAQTAVIEGEIDKYITTIRQTKEAQQQLKERLKNTAAPAKIAEIDLIQNKLLEKLKLNGISIQSLTRAPIASPTGENLPNGIEYDLAISGSWEATMRYLDDMQKDDILINLRQLAMEPVQNSNSVKTTCRYKIYVE